MRLALLAAVVASMAIQAAADCTFEVYAPEQPRTFYIDLLPFRDGVPLDVYAYEIPFVVAYDAELDTFDWGNVVSDLTIRPRSMDPPSIEWLAGGEFPVRLSSIPPPPPPPWVPLPVNIDGFVFSVDAQGVNYGPAGQAGVNAFMGVITARSGFHSADSTATGWEVSQVGPRTEILDPAAYTTAIIDARVGGHRYDVAYIEWGWRDATVTLRSDDCLCHGDLNADGAVDQGDLDLVLLNWGREPVAEWSHDAPEIVQQASLDSVLLAWGDVSPPKPLGVGAVPEPSAVVLAVVLLVCAAFKRA